MSNSHHTEKENELSKELRELMKDAPPLGATGQFPRGKLHKEDEGEFRFAIATDLKRQVVHIDFGKSVAWLGLPKKEALALAKMIREHAGKPGVAAMGILQDYLNGYFRTTTKRRRALYFYQRRAWCGLG